MHSLYIEIIIQSYRILIQRIKKLNKKSWVRLHIQNKIFEKNLTRERKKIFSKIFQSQPIIISSRRLISKAVELFQIFL